MESQYSDKTFKLNSQEITVQDRTPLSSTIVETFIWEPTSSLEESLGSLFIVGQIYSSRKRKDNALLLNALATIVKDEYYRNPDRDPLRSFKLSLRRASKILDEKRYWLEGSFKLNLIIVAVAPPRFFAAHLGEGVLFLLRNGAVHSLEASALPVWGRTTANHSFLTATEGFIRPEDTLLLATREIHKLNPSTAQTLIASKELEKFILEREKEFRNLGLMTIGFSKKLFEATEDRRLIRAHSATKRRFLVNLGLLGRDSILRRGVTISLLVLAVLILTFTALRAQKRTSSAEARAMEIVKEMVVLKEKAASLVELDNYVEAKAAVADWENKLKELNSLKVLEKEYTMFLKDFNEAKIVTGRYERVGARAVINLEGNTVGFNPQGIAGDEDAIFLFAKNTFYKFLPAKESGGFTVLPTPENGPGHEIRDFIPFSSNPLEVFILSDDLISSYTNEFSPLFADSSFLEVLKIEIYKNAFYLLGKDIIWQAEIENKTIREWGQGKLFTDAKDFAIDGFIYVLEEGKISKLLNGSRHSEIAIEPGISQIATGANLENLYLLNPQEGTVVVTDKLGNVLRRLINDDLKDAVDIVVAKDEKTLWFLKGQKVFSISIPST